jgi:uncharacterized DUF497 family protein
MKIEFDPAKSVKNLTERGLPFEVVADFDFSSAIIWQDDRFNYPETRIIALGLIGHRLHVVCFTAIEGGIRIISLRKANRREITRYEQETSDK